ncbi:cupin domain-containing protein [Epibacterium sp. MM17-32]|uniref:cupin domain-containing protein n=1 Tax=Epibacterium sp. MM17-32 TaxID=2917734 RepID=UPI001EF5F6DE|nr:cupin domain-containing protein [Epibacterium sp. MM17-32]MCG7629306.1 cupin domain-containing protein [Epibacterium sp. MM17-32]
MLDKSHSDRFDAWPETLQQEITENWTNCRVGSHLVSETETLRIWHLHLEPGERAPFHRHEETYFWTVTGPGKSRSHYHDGSVRDTVYAAGDTRHFQLGAGEFFVHDLENTGTTPLVFVTVEFKS